MTTMTRKEIGEATEAGKRVGCFFDKIGNSHHAIIVRAVQKKVVIQEADVYLEVVENHLGEIADDYGFENGFCVRDDFAEILK